ncbi:MAG: proteasome assembly chaperone family protein [Candidatus Aenigmarchaeota archaeon]|nr:proteasome assembly chaperone family protein [Candidatus Aenigmarchaeota archaeon]
MSSTAVYFSKKPKLTSPVMIEGLPGIGYIGKNVVDYLIDELKAEKFGEILSSYFPPLVLMNPEKNGLIEELKNEFYYVKKGKNLKNDLILLTGDTQSIDMQGHFVIGRKIIEVAHSYGTKRIITLGGFSTGALSEKDPKVFGAGTDEKIIKEFEKYNVVFKKSPIGQIIGASGILLSIAKRHNMDGVCLMGETSGILSSDPKSTEGVINVLSSYIGFKINLEKLDKRAKEMDKIIKKLEKVKKGMVSGKTQTSEQLGYIG